MDKPLVKSSFYNKDYSIMLQLYPIRSLNISNNFLMGLNYNIPTIIDIKDSTVNSLFGVICPYNRNYIASCEDKNNAYIDVDSIITLGKYDVGGAYGTMYKAILDNKSLMIKHTRFNKSERIEVIDTFDNEICNQTKAFMEGIAPFIFSYWLCQTNNAIIIMENIESITLLDYFKIPRAKVVEALLYTFHITMKLNLVLNISHNDLHLGNVLVSNDKTYIIDYGSSKTMKPIESYMLDWDFLFVSSSKAALKYRHDILEILIFNELYHLSWSNKLAENKSLKTIDDIYKYTSHMFMRITNPSVRRGLPDDTYTLEYGKPRLIVIDNNPDIKNNGDKVYHGTYGNIKIALYTYTNGSLKEAVALHHQAQEIGITCKLLAYGHYDQGYFIIKDNSVDQQYDLIRSENVLHIFNLYMDILKLFLVFNVDLNRTHNDAKIKSVLIHKEHVLLKECSYSSVYVKYENLISITSDFMNFLNLSGNIRVYFKMMSTLISLYKDEGAYDTWDNIFQKVEERIGRKASAKDIIDYMEKYRNKIMR